MTETSSGGAECQKLFLPRGQKALSRRPACARRANAPVASGRAQMRFDALAATANLAAMRNASSGWRLWLWLACGAPAWGAGTFSVGSYNLENYLAAPTETRRAKTPEAMAKVREMIRALNADVLGVQEMGGTNALLELRAALRVEGLEYPYWEWVAGPDPDIHVALLSKFPLTARRPQTNDNFLLHGRRFRVSRGFAEVDVRVNPRYEFTLLVAHLKSRRPVPEADQAELREEEAKILREKISARLAANRNANLLVIGDFNDTKDSKAVRTVIGRGANALHDTRPAERNGDARQAPRPGWSPMNISWTYFYGKEDRYERIDYLLVSRGMEHEWVEADTLVLAAP